MAFMISGAGRLAFCSRSRRQGGQWNIFSDAQYESAVYSSLHRRLLCLTRTMKLEAWDVAGESPTLDWAVHLNHHSDSHSHSQLACVRYLACEEQTGDLFVVLRFFQKTNTNAIDEDGEDEYKEKEKAKDKYADDREWSEYKEEDEEARGWYPVDPSVYFEVYKIDGQRGSMTKMEESLDGMSIFVGMNDSVALKIPPEEKERVPISPDQGPPKVAEGRINIFYTYEQQMQMKIKMKMMKIICGDEDKDEDEDEDDDDEDKEEEEDDDESMRDDCVHFTYDDRIGRNKYIGKFDYKTKEVEPLSLPCLQAAFLPAEDDVDIAYPLWFTPGDGSPLGTLKDTYFPNRSDYVPLWEMSSGNSSDDEWDHFPGRNRE